MTNIENEAAPLRKEKRERDNDVIERMFVWAFIMLVVLSEIAAIVFVILKLAKIVEWAWPVTLTPVWVLIATSMSLATAAFVADKIGRRSDKKCHRCAERGADHRFDDKGNMVYLCQKCRNGVK